MTSLLCSHGISHTEVFNSVWKVIDAINGCKALKISYPENHIDQFLILEGFRLKSGADIQICARCINGCLIWFDMATKAGCEAAGCGQKKFFCGQKKKFGVNLQAVCDSNSKFLDVSIGLPGWTSDYLVFTTS
jgi:DDE superfamily endonuclease